jgi:hypothetical protein
MSDIDPVDLRMVSTSRPWELQGLTPSVKRSDLSDEENAENMFQVFVNLPAEVITQRVSMIHVEFSKFFRADYFNDESNSKGGPLALLLGIQQCFIDSESLYSGY